MNTLVLYFRHEDIYNKSPSNAALTDTFLTTLLTKGTTVEAHVIGEDKKFANGSKHLKVKSEACDVLLIGTIPYHLLIANLYHLEEAGFTVTINPQYLTTDIENPSYPAEYIKNLE